MSETHRCAVPLDLAQLCIEGDCEAIWALNGNIQCPRCGSAQSLSLANILDRETDSPSDPASVYEDDVPV